MTNTHFSRNRRSCFTLIELLVVIAIISILAAMLLPTLSKARAKAQKMICMNNGSQLMKGMDLYADDFDGRFPRAVDCDNWSQPSDGSFKVSNWAWQLHQYIGDVRVYECSGAIEVAWNPLDSDADDVMSWTYNYEMAGPRGRIDSPSQKVAIWECGKRQDYAESKALDNHVGYFWPQLNFDWVIPHDSNTTYAMPFIDGHVSSMTYIYGATNKDFIAAGPYNADGRDKGPLK